VIVPTVARWATRPADPPLDPSGEEARSELRRELLKPEYHERNLAQEIWNWILRRVDQGLQAASDAPPLSTLAAMVIFVGLALALGYLLSRARLTARTAEDGRAVLTDEVITADELRARALAALEAGRNEDAVVDGFRALAVRQVERGRLADNPGATAHEVALDLAEEFPALRDQVVASAELFDEVLYGHHPATAEQARSILVLDSELTVRR
jgi:Domain of unknown function (DUF4129)